LHPSFLTHCCVTLAWLLPQLLAYVQSDAGAGLQTSVIAALQRFAGGRFDRLTHTGAISTLMESLAPESAEDYVGSLFSSFLSGLPVGQTDDTPAAAAGDDDEEALEAQRCLTGRRVWAIEQLCGASHVLLQSGVASMHLWTGLNVPSLPHRAQACAALLARLRLCIFE
jgi:hypothetical protein